MPPAPTAGLAGKTIHSGTLDGSLFAVDIPVSGAERIGFRLSTNLCRILRGVGDIDD